VVAVTGSGKAVFLSYASQDAETAKRICDALRAAGIEVWFDQSELRGGDAWDASIRRQIKACALFIPIISHHTHTRDEGYFRLEWKLAVDRSHLMVAERPFLLPVVIDDTSDQDEKVPDRFRDVQWTRLPDGQRAEAFVERVCRLLSPDPTMRNAASALSSPLPTASIRSTSPATRLDAPTFVLAEHSVPANETPSRAAADVEAVGDKSIAVLPFTDMSEKKDQEYMSDGIAEQLLDLLAQAPGLKVIARTSSFAFKGKSVEIVEIAKKLGVANVLEGSVRTSGGRIRITAKLIRAADSSHLWSKTFDRPLGDVFAVQDEIAGSIAQALEIRLGGGELSGVRGGTLSLEAYQLFLRAVSAVNEPTKVALESANGYLERAIKLDPGYGLAWAGLGGVFIVKADLGIIGASEGYGRARQLEEQALKVSPQLAEAHAHLGSTYMALDHDWAAAEGELKRALAIDATNPWSLNEAGRLAYALGRWRDAERYLRRGLVRDPLNPYLIFNLGATYYLEGRFVDAEKTYRTLLRQKPDFPYTSGWLARTLLALGKADEAMATNPEDSVYSLLPVLLQATGHQAEADRALAAQIEKRGGTYPSIVAQSFAYRGDRDHAFEWLERAYSAKDIGLCFLIGEPLYRNLWPDPRWKAFLHKLNLQE
jgi:TolB-like protein/tetratricopeptide (TPR) repeat protein